MERNFYDDEFEDFLKERSDQYKLYPSGRVWTGISDFLHVKRKWQTITGTLLLLTMLVFISLEIDSSGHYNKNKKEIASASLTSLASSGTGSSAVTLAFNAPDAANNSENNNSSPLLITAATPLPTVFGLKPASDPRASYEVADGLPGLLAGASAMNTNQEATSGYKLLPQAAPQPTAGKKESAINWLQERVVNRLMPKINKKVKLQFYFSPTASYRQLKNNKDANPSQSIQVSPLSGDPINVDGIVNHQPAIGLELGSSLALNVTKNLVLKAGAQLNYVRYNIRAYKSYPERSDITLSSVVNSHSETITSYSSIRNVGGRYPEELQNQYVQISMPIGAELKVLGNKRLQLNVAGTVQPTYLLYNNTYVLSTNYTNYTKDPGLVRKWNVNAAVETYLSYQTGGLRWQVGPQFRYQLLSTYTDRYPIREYLMEYGVKLGVTKTIR